MSTIEQRRFPRHRVLKPARIIAGESDVFDCTVRNLSETGALLEVPAFLELPNAFDVSMSNVPARHCQVAWRNAYQIGVEFTRATSKFSRATVH
jgi:hypothetical protein